MSLCPDLSCSVPHLPAMCVILSLLHVVLWPQEVLEHGGYGMVTRGDPSFMPLWGGHHLSWTEQDFWLPGWDFGGITLWFIFGSSEREGRCVPTYL